MVSKHKPEQIAGKLRKAEIGPAKGGMVADACRRPRRYHRDGYHGHYGPRGDTLDLALVSG